MNENVRKLYDQSLIRDDYVNIGPEGLKLGFRFSPDKFAELLIKECIELVEPCKCGCNDGDKQTGTALSTTATMLRKHFGVTE